MGVLGFAREDDFDPLIWSAAARYGIDPLLIKATIAKESGFNPDAYRWEPALGDASVGLMQTLVSTARSLGYPGDQNGLRDPATSIEYGTAYLAQQWARYAGSPTQATDAYAAYNSGAARRDAGGFYVNSRGSRYVQSVVDVWARYYQTYRTAYGSATTPIAGEPGPLTAGGGVVPDILRDLFGASEPVPGAPTPPAAEASPASSWWETIGSWFAPAPALAGEPVPTPAPAPTGTLDPFYGFGGEPTAADSWTVDTLLTDLGFPTTPAPAGPAGPTPDWTPYVLAGAAALVLLLVVTD